MSLVTGPLAYGKALHQWNLAKAARGGTQSSSSPCAKVQSAPLSHAPRKLKYWQRTVLYLPGACGTCAGRHLEAPPTGHNIDSNEQSHHQAESRRCGRLGSCAHIWDMLPPLPYASDPAPLPRQLRRRSSAPRAPLARLFGPTRALPGARAKKSWIYLEAVWKCTAERE